MSRQNWRFLRAKAKLILAKVIAEDLAFIGVGPTVYALLFGRFSQEQQVGGRYSIHYIGERWMFVI